MEPFAETVSGFRSFNIFAKSHFKFDSSSVGPFKNMNYAFYLNLKLMVQDLFFLILETPDFLKPCKFGMPH